MKTNHKIAACILIISALILFSSCIDTGPSVYSEPWYESEGYVISKKSSRTNSDKFESFEQGDVPEGKTVAVQHEHSYISRPRCNFEVQVRTTDIENDIADELVTDPKKSKSFVISTTPYEEIAGFVFYCDNDTVYVINKLYSLGYTDAKSKSTAQYCFRIKINGIKYLDLYMNYNSSKPY